MSHEQATAERPWRRIPRWSRMAIELAAVLAAVVGYEALRHRGTFPRPTIRELRHGGPAERAEALRSLSLFGAAGAEAIPALIEALRSDPDPALRRGAAFVLGGIAEGTAPGEAFSIGLLLSGVDDLRLAATDAEAARPPAPAHPRGPEVAAALVAAMESDPDPTVRERALASLARPLSAATGTRPPRALNFSGIMDDPAPEPRLAAEIPAWAPAAARALASQVEAGPAGVAHAALAWAFADPAAPALLGDDGRWDALVAAASRSIRLGQPTYLDRLIVKAVAVSVRDAPAHRDAFLGLISSAMATPPAGHSVEPDALSYVAWLAAPPARRLREHPEAIAGMARLLGPDAPSVPYTLRRVDHRQVTQAIIDSHFMRLTALGDVPEGTPEQVVLGAIREDVALLDLLGAHAEGIDWLPMVFYYVLAPCREDLLPVLSDPAVRPTLPPDLCGAAAARVLDAVDRIPEGGRGRSQRTDPHLFGLALASYFVRGSAPDAPAVDRFAGMIVLPLMDPWPPTAQLAIRLGRSLPGQDGAPAGGAVRGPGRD